MIPYDPIHCGQREKNIPLGKTKPLAQMARGYLFYKGSLLGCQKKYDIDIITAGFNLNLLDISSVHSSVVDTLLGCKFFFASMV